MMECLKFKFLFSALLAVCSCAIANAQSGHLSALSQGLVPGTVNERGEEIVGTETGFAAVLTLDDNNLRTLLRQGRVEIAIPPQLINSVDSIIIKRPVYFKEAKAKDFANAELAGRKLVVSVDRSVIERIDYQPVELRVYESGYSSVVLNFDARSRPSTPGKAVGDPASDSPLLTVKLKSGNGISGRIKGMKKLDLDSSLGNISVDFDRTNKITVRDDGELGIEMVNGDLISGKIEGGEFVLINRWSDETIQFEEVSSLIIRKPTRSISRSNQQANRFAVPNGAVKAHNSRYWTPTVVPYQ